MCEQRRLSRVCALFRVCASVLVDVVNIWRNYGSMNGGIFDEISSFIAYAQSIYLTCMRNYARACMYEYLVRLEVFIFV